jgi:hypothetical protein
VAFDSGNSLPRVTAEDGMMTLRMCVHFALRVRKRQSVELRRINKTCALYVGA